MRRAASPTTTENATSHSMRLLRTLLLERYRGSALQFLPIAPPGSPRTMWDTFSPLRSTGGSEEAIEVAVFQLDEVLRAVGSSIAALPAVPKISHLRMNAPKNALSPEFATWPQKDFADTHTPYLTMRRM